MLFLERYNSSDYVPGRIEAWLVSASSLFNKYSMTFYVLQHLVAVSGLRVLSLVTTGDQWYHFERKVSRCFVLVLRLIALSPQQPL